MAPARPPGTSGEMEALVPSRLRCRTRTLSRVPGAPSLLGTWAWARAAVPLRSAPCALLVMRAAGRGSLERVASARGALSSQTLSAAPLHAEPSHVDRFGCGLVCTAPRAPLHAHGDGSRDGSRVRIAPDGTQQATLEDWAAPAASACANAEGDAVAALDGELEPSRIASSLAAGAPLCLRSQPDGWP